MKKIFKNMAWMLTATLVMAACSDSLDESDNTGQGPLTGEGYVKVAINMPTTNGSMTRVDDGSILDDGLENEYKVNSGIIAFFKAGSTQSNPDENATFVKAYNLTSLTQQDDNADPQVSTRVTTTTEAPLVGDSEQLYALVILNPNTNVVSVKSSGVLTVGTTDLSSTSKLADLQTKLENQTLTDYTGRSNNAFLMTNAPLSTFAGNQTLSSATAKILVPVTVHETKAAAEGDTDPARIYVERVVAKVTLSGFTYSNSDNEYTKVATVTTSKPNGDTESVYNGDIIQLQGWVLTVTNKSTKLVRDVSNFSSWLTTTDNNNASRFVGTNTIAMADNQSYYRIYWAEDGNYDNTGTTPTTDFTTYTTDDITANIPWNKDAEHDTSSSPLYCLENTMNYDEQIDDRTTSVLLKTEYRVKFHKDDTPDARDFYICGTSPTKYPKESITIDVQEGTTIQGIVEYVKTTASVNDLALQEGVNGGIYEGTDGMKALFKKTNAPLSDEEATKIWNAVGPIKYYKGGVSYYYAALIRHFNDTEADWEADETYALKHLGRYGVVRNNWYDITINSISGPGDPEIIPPSGNPDDKTEGYIKCEINVLSWAKRSQGVDL